MSASVAVINVDACPFLTVSDLTCHFEYTRIGVVALCHLIEKSNLEVTTTRLHNEQVKYWGSFRGILCMGVCAYS